MGAEKSIKSVAIIGAGASGMYQAIDSFLNYLSGETLG